jgi:alkylation response protein AidB-like acyl-CoA dehydrogenase
MDFALSGEQLALQSMTADFFSSLGGPARTRQSLETGAPVESVNAELAQVDLIGLLVPEEAGGSGASLLDLAVAAEQAGRFLAPDTLVGTAARAVTLLRGPQSADLLARVIKGAATISVLDGDGFVLDGRAVTGTSQPGLQARTAGTFLLRARGADGSTAVVSVENGAGVDIRDEQPLDPSRDLARVRLEGATATILLTEAEADAAWRRSQDLAVIVLAAQGLGAVSESVRSAVDYAKTREAFGRAIGSFQAVKHSLVDVYQLEEQLRSLVWLAAWSADTTPETARLYGSAASAYARDALERAAEVLIHVHGGTGFTWEHDAHLYWRRAKTDRFLLGSAREHRAAVARLVMEGASHA